MLKILFLQCLTWVLRALLSLRYRIETKGLEQLKEANFSRSGGILFLPNHPAEIDPIILEALLWKRFQLRPLIVEHFYYLKGFRFFLDLVGALPLPSTDHFANRWQEKKVKKQFDLIVQELKKKANFLIYPSGRLKQSGKEIIGGSSFVHDLLEACPEAHVVLVRTTGLWGSQFSKALTGASPDFGKAFLKGCKILLKNGIFFAPRRSVLVEFSLPPADFPQHAARLDFNRYLEEWYNRYPEKGEEPLRLVSYAFWKEELPELSCEEKRVETGEKKEISPEIEKQVLSHLASLSGIALGKIERKMHLSHDLGLDSLDIPQLYVFLEERFGIEGLRPGELRFVEDVLQAAAGYQKEEEKVTAPKKEEKRSWPKEGKRHPPEILEAKTIQEAFLKSVDRNGSLIACADALSGALSYRKLKMAALLLSSHFQESSASHIGVLLPSSVGAYVVILGILLAKKVPVMLNWTAGSKALSHAITLTKLEKIISSERFLFRLENVDLGPAEELFSFLEEIKEKLRFKEKWRAFCLSFWGAKRLLKSLNLQELSSQEPAVILFTSGTENLPKGVPLSHENLLSNQRACLEAARLSASDVLYGILPPFHSFGFSVTGLLPLLAGLKIYYAPDPTDSRAMARDIAAYGPTLFCSAPSFIKGLFRVAAPSALSSLRLVVAGAEKAPPELFEYVEKQLPHCQLLEGYGITECSPVVTLDRRDEPHVGVGKPLKGVALCVIDSETQQLLEPGKEGEICIAGPSVFPGYLGTVERSAFVKIDGKEWYLSGDRGHLDVEGHLILSGRLKRFVKIGGEMISLGAIEQELFAIAGRKGWIDNPQEGIPLGVSVKEKDSDKPLLILFTTFPVTKEAVNLELKQSGFGTLVKIAEVRQIEEIPLTGTGKVHYRRLDELVCT